MHVLLLPHILTMTRAITDRLSEPSDPLMCSSPPRHRVGALAPTRWKALAFGRAEAPVADVAGLIPESYTLFVIFQISIYNHHNHHEYSISSKHLKTPKKKHDQLQHSPGFLVTPSLHHHHLPHHRRLCVAFCKKPTQALAASRAPPKASWSC